MKLSVLALAVISLAMTVLPANADPNCKCRANGTKFDIGDIACIRLPSGSRLVQCEMVLNNTSWKILSGSCPSARLENREQSAPMSLAPAGSGIEPVASPGNRSEGISTISISG